MTLESKVSAFKAEHPDAYEAIRVEGFKAGQVKGHDEGITSERERVKLLASCKTFAGRTDFVLEQIAKGSEIGAAKGEFADALALENAELRKAKAKTESTEALAAAAHEQGPAFAGANLANQGGAGGDPITLFKAAVDAKVKAGLTAAKANLEVIRENPQLHAAYLEAYNAKIERPKLPAGYR